MKKFIFIYIFCFIQVIVLAQGGDEWNNRTIPIYDKDIEVARESITFTPNFETPVNPDFLAYIDPDLPLNGGEPVSDGVFNLNYIRIYEPIRNNITNEIPIHNEIDYVNEWRESITYFDGLGREMQQTLVKGSSYGNDIIVPVIYDDFGLKKETYLPYAIAQDGDNGSGGYRPLPINETKDFHKNYYGELDGEYPLSNIKFDGSPLNRVMRQSNPGSDWKLNGINTLSYEYKTNETSEMYKFSISESNQLIKDGCYDPNTLFKNIFLDEDNHKTIEYKDLNNRVVTKSVYTGTEWLITQYVYDDFGLLRFVLSPESYSYLPAGDATQTFPLTTDWIKQLCYYYKYDDRKRMAIKKLPGADEVYLVYNIRDQLVLSQDGVLRENNDWLFMKYDVFNRPIITGKYHHGSLASQQVMQNTLNGLIDTDDLYEEYIDNVGYSNHAYPEITASDEILTLSYYDNYDALELETAPGAPEVYDFIPDDLPFYFLENGTYSTKVKGLPTITKTKVLLHDELQVAKDWLVSVTYYDKYQHAIQSITDNHMGGKSVLSSQINFTGEVEQTKEHIILSTETTTIQQQFAYDHTGKIIETKHKINNQNWVVMNNLKYNETGQLTRKQLHKNGNSFLQTVDHKYNIRGWMTNINDVDKPDNDLFSMKLEYNTSENSSQYNGNIGSIKWKSAKFDNLMQYDYNYDGANRILSSKYSDAEKYSTEYSYDKNGNIETLMRMGELSGAEEFNMIDELTYKYTGNQLKYVNDEPGQDYQENGFTDNGSFLSTNEYFYDLNGNLTKDLNKQIDNIDYNYLNLPQHISMIPGANNAIDYLYSANGVKLQKSKTINGDQGDLTHYLGNIVFTNETPDYIFTPEGRATPNQNGGFGYEYYLTDHLGNTRVSFNQSGKVLQDNSYYPFGMSMGESLSFISDISTENKYKYNGKEMQDDFGLDWYDYGARFYDPALGRWHVVDPLTYERTWVSPYNYTQNNPLNRIDPNGALDDWVEKTLEDGAKSVEWDENVTSADDTDLQKDDKYLGKEGYGIEGKGDNEGLVKYGSDGKKYDASLGLAEVEINGGVMSDHARTMSNPLVQSIHKGQNDFLKGSALLATDIMGNVGTGVTLVGYGAAFLPGGQAIAGGLIGTGKVMTTTAGFLQLGINVQEGNYGQAATNFGFMAGGAVLGTKINSLNFGKQSTAILKTGADLKLNLGNRVVNTVIDRRKNK
jgi:RHS repeat-associated protein